jgi:hypothetical protein
VNLDHAADIRTVDNPYSHIDILKWQIQELSTWGMIYNACISAHSGSSEIMERHRSCILGRLIIEV